MVKLKQEVETWGLPCLFTCCETPIISNFENISRKAPKEVCPLHMINKDRLIIHSGLASFVFIYMKGLFIVGFCVMQHVALYICKD